MRCHARPFVLLAAAVLAGCGEPAAPRSGATGRIAIHADFSVASTVATLVVRVSAPDMPYPLAYNVWVADGAANASLQIPAGSDRSIVLSAYDRSGVETHRGELLLTIREGVNATVNVTLTPLSGTQPITVSMGSVIVIISPDTASVMLGSSWQYNATVLDEFAQAMNVHPAWLTLDPTIVTVDQNGYATAAGVGTGRIVAAYAGVGAMATLNSMPFAPASKLPSRPREFVP